MSKMNVLITQVYDCLYWCFKLFQTISNKNKTCNGPGSHSESENRTWHHAQTSWRKSVFYILFESIINLSLMDFFCTIHGNIVKEHPVDCLEICCYYTTEKKKLREKRYFLLAFCFCLCNKEMHRCQQWHQTACKQFNCINLM